MIEMAPAGEHGLYRRGVAGDTFNTAVYLARLGCAVSYLTRLGDDPCSRDILARLGSEAIDDRLVRQVDGRQPGLYLIDNDTAGERRFTYWRDHSPARDTFDTVPEIGGVNAFYFSGITLAVCRSGLDNLVALLEKLRGDGCHIAFDPNYRPALWNDPEEAHDYYRAVLPLCDTVLPTLEDETRLWGIGLVADCAVFYRELGAREVVIKAPDLQVHGFCDDRAVVVAAQPVAAVDTTGAGDAFNAGFLAARLQGSGLQEAITAGQSLAGRVVRYRGAIIDREHMIC